MRILTLLAVSVYGLAQAPLPSPVNIGGGGGGGTGTVTSITIAGTANQIAVSGTCTITTTGTCTLSLPSNVVLPGTINSMTLTTSTGTFTLTNLKTFTVNNTLTLQATDGTTLVIANPSAITDGDCVEWDKVSTTLTLTTSAGPCGSTLATPYIPPSIGASPFSITGATHGKGIYPIVYCYDSASNPQTYVSCQVQNNPSNGDLTITYTTAPGQILVYGAIGGGGSGSSAFSALTSSTNTTAAMVVGTGASLGVSGSGTIAATTAAALASNPSDCSANQFASAIAANGNLTCSAVALAALATQAADTVVMNATGSTAVPTAVAMPTGGTNGCAGSANALTYNTTTHAYGCNTISGSGTVDSATAGQVAYYTGTTTVDGDAGMIYDPTTDILAVAGAVATGASPPSVTAGTGGGDAYAEGTAPSICAASGVICMYADSTAHALLASYNNDSYVPLTRTIASGAKALDTDAISSTACDTMTATATGVVSTDTIQWTPNADITGVTGYVPSTSGGLSIFIWPTSNTINIKVCNPTSGPITPGAVTLNWRVVR